ncbi:MAG: amidohydrolase family protein [Planctomycetes bacterium]|nr:amidohydrolase family protein [Planctomycetota bacterium]
MSDEPLNGVLAVEAVLVGPERLHRGALALAQGMVAALCPSPARCLPGAFAVPGLRNAHTHLDLSLVTDLPRAEHGFAAWILDLLRARGPLDPAALQRAAQAGARDALASGTTAVADIDSSGAAAAAVAASGLKGMAFRELLGSRAAQADEARRWVDDFSAFAPGGRLRPGVSPHAPYSTAPELYRAALALAAERELCFTTHIAETREEAEYVHTGGGAFRELLQRLRAAPPFSSAPGVSPIRYAHRLGALRAGVLLAHCNYPEEGDIELIAESGATVVFCPRSHDFFAHDPHPVARCLAAGVPVALGTDSRASNRSLSLLDEMAFLRGSRPDLSPATIFWMATGAAARLLDGGSGRLEPGAAADVALLVTERAVPRSVEEALDIVTSGAARVAATLVSGRLRHLAEVPAWEARCLTPGGCGLFSSFLEGPRGDSSS